jgi:hypothetical protein
LQEPSTSVGQRDLTAKVPPDTERVVVGRVAEGGALAPLDVDLPGGAAPLHLDRGVPEIEGEARDGAAHGVGDQLLAAGRQIGGDERHERADHEDRGDEDDASPGREARRTSNFWHAKTLTGRLPSITLCPRAVEAAPRPREGPSPPRPTAVRRILLSARASRTPGTPERRLP